MNPVKIVAGGSAGGTAALIAVYIAGRLGVTLTGDDGAVIGVAAVGVAAFVAHNGLVGIAKMIWSGEPKPAATVARGLPADANPALNPVPDPAAPPPQP